MILLKSDSQIAETFQHEQLLWHGEQLRGHHYRAAPLLVISGKSARDRTARDQIP